MDAWYYTVRGERRGPVDLNALKTMASAGIVSADDLAWRDGMSEWTTVAKLREFNAANAPVLAAGSPPPLPEPSVGRQRPKTAFQFETATPPRPPAVPPPTGVPVPSEVKKPARGALRDLGGKISEAADLPEIEDVPVRQVLYGGLSHSVTQEDIEEAFSVGSPKTTPDLANIPAGWPQPRVCWRVLGAAIATFILMRTGMGLFQNPNFIPGVIIVGAFIVPFSTVVFFFETNTPRNVSIYQVAKMLLLGGAVGLVATMILLGIVPGSGTGSFVPALLTGVVEETGKMLALLLIVSSPRHKWQTNGLLLGAAVGAGFAGFETAGYAFRNLTYVTAGNQLLFASDQTSVFDSIMLRGILAPGGHVIWTAMIGSAIWKVKGDSPFDFSMMFHAVVVRRWIIAVLLHGAWDTDFAGVNPYLKFGLLIVVGWYITFAILKQALSEVESARTRRIGSSNPEPLEGRAAAS